MTAPQQSCPRCHLYLSARGCTPERCANPEGAAELERLNAGRCQGFLRGPCEMSRGHAGKHHSAMDGDWSEREGRVIGATGKVIGHVKTPSIGHLVPAQSDLDTFRAMLRRYRAGAMGTDAGAKEDALHEENLEHTTQIFAGFSWFCFDNETGSLITIVRGR